MRPKSLILLSLALGCGLVAALGINQMMAKQGPVTINTGETLDIYVTLKDINTNDLVEAESLKLEPWPKDKVPPDAIEALDDVVGRRARTKLFAGEPVRDAKLLEKGDAGMGAADSIPAGFRVVSVRVDAVKSSGNLIKPGDRVDVIVHMTQPGGGSSDAISKTFLQDVRVFAVNAEIERADNGTKVAAQTIGLLVKPEQVELITLAEEMGKIRLSMRSPNDDAKLQTDGAMQNNLLGDNRNTNSRAEESQSLPSESATPSVDNPLLSFLDKFKGPASPHTTVEAEKPPFRMTIIRGPDVEQLELDAEGKLNSASKNSGKPGIPGLPAPQSEPKDKDPENDAS
jgi:pilus assembly protein CpaB